MRLQRILAVAWRDLHLVNSGKGWWKLPLLALALLLPAGAAPLPIPTHPDERPAMVVGPVPQALQDHVQRGRRGSGRFVAEEPPTLRTFSIPPQLRTALDSAGLPGAVVRVERLGGLPDLPGRSLLVALLALSLLTGPLAESLAGERRRGTLETLLTAGLSRWELVAGKWFAWTASASLITGLVAVVGMLDGSQDPGLWPLGLPLVAGNAVALGLWLGRQAPDEVAGATRTMRALPVAAVLLAGVAYALREVHPALGAAVPLGGALLVAGDVSRSALEVGACALGSAAACGLALWHTGRDLTRMQSASGRWAGLGVLGLAAMAWWVPAAGPSLWSVAGNPDVAARASAPAALATGGALLLGLVLVQQVRAHQSIWPKRPDLATALIALAVGAALAASAALSGVVPWPEAPLLAALRGRMASGLAPGWIGLGVVLVAVGHEAFFRGWVQQRWGVLGSVVAWTLIISPLDPVRGVISGLALALLARRGGWVAAAVAHLAWALTSSHLSFAVPWVAGVAAVVAVVAPLLRDPWKRAATSPDCPPRTPSTEPPATSP